MERVLTTLVLRLLWPLPAAMLDIIRGVPWLSIHNLVLSEVLYPSSDISDPESLKSTGFLFDWKEGEGCPVWESKERSRLEKKFLAYWTINATSLVFNYVHKPIKKQMENQKM